LIFTRGLVASSPAGATLTGFSLIKPIASPRAVDLTVTPLTGMLGGLGRIQNSLTLAG